MNKKLWCLIIMLVISIVPFKVSALHIEEIPKDEYILEYANPTAVLDSNVLHLDSLSKPTSLWNIDEDGPYTANIIEAGWQQLYTNKVFKANSSGVLYIDYTLVGKEPGYNPKVKIRLYEKDKDKVKETYTVQTPTAACLRIDGLSKSKTYYFSFQAVKLNLAQKSATGTAKIYH